MSHSSVHDPSESESEEQEQEEDGENGEDGEDDNGVNANNEEGDSNEGSKEDNEEDLTLEDVNKNGESSTNNNDQQDPVSKSSNDGHLNGNLQAESCSSNSKPFDPNQPSTSSGITKASEEEEEEPNNTEISWEVLTMARDVFEKQLKEGKDVNYKLSETLQKMGEIATEWENNELAIQLLTQCLTLRQQFLPEDDRLIAETYYHIGNAHSFISQVELANDAFQRAISVIRLRIENQKKVLADGEIKDEDKLHAIKEEINELEGLLPEMVARIEDKRDQMATVEEGLKMEAKEKDEEAQIASLKLCEPKPINNVSHLVKRKKADQGNSDNVKKICPTPVSNSNSNSTVESISTSDSTKVVTESSV